MKITPHIHALKIPFKVPIAPGKVIERFVFVFVIVGDKICLIDTGVSGSEKMIFDYVKGLGRDPKDISKVVLTHSHPDHIGSLKKIKELTGCSVFAHMAERSWIEDVELQNTERPVPGFNSLVEGSVIVDITIGDDDEISLDKDLSLRVIHTPGHSKGSLSFHMSKDNALFCGDAVIVPGNMPIYDDISSSIDSLKKLKTIKNVDILLSSWDEPQRGETAYGTIENGIEYLKKIDRSIKEAAIQYAGKDDLEFSAAVLNKIGLPETMLNPLILRSFRSGMER